ncbi:kinase-like protein [Dothidotthia symphoricarpi CBS 119687]|uniref:Kinase-like protein n=1 Tax=Dothidotthia symphoricarpi CBS 119687 TaxID=1392245 RepID=A0A6A6AMF5_9PLEO|nr:kinase-like protein [Dothidotthia symphoricarpi CBS 119687]KAF2132114.1 kinase-like protein [Dothidotthia symphoricarpi CBS 119687]
MDTTRTKSPRIQPRFRTKALQILVLTVTKLATQRFISKLFTRSSGTILYLNFCIKFGDSVTLQEADTLQFIARHTSVPVPKVYHAFIHHGRTYILMERIRGETIAKRWRSLSATSKSLIFSHLKRMVEELRSIPCQADGVSNVDGGPIHDYRLPQTSSWGPFDTVSDFHLALRNNVTLNPAVISDVKQLVTFHESVVRPPVLTHGDLSSLNILIRDDTVVGIIDWDTAGWMPYYWEYTTAWHANPQNQFWQNEVCNFLDPQEEELSMEKVRRTYFGDI